MEREGEEEKDYKNRVGEEKEMEGDDQKKHRIRGRETEDDKCDQEDITTLQTRGPSTQGMRKDVIR